MSKELINNEKKVVDTKVLEPITFHSLLKIEDLLKIFSITRATLSKIIKNKQITTPIKIGKHSRWDPQDIRRDLDRMRGEVKTR